MSTETPGGGRPTESLPVRGPAGGRVYGPGGAPMGPTPTREPRWLLPGAAGVGAAGVLLGVLLATGLTPF
ncbi:MAG TPA: hypothetical protein VES42_15370, partial [Pilimelia sp.]|nr:hypothetical protein [Pilimelia sp.]